MLLVKISTDDILNYCSYFSHKAGFDISCKLSAMETFCMKCQNLFSGENVINLLSVELAKRVVKVMSKFLSFRVDS